MEVWNIVEVVNIEGVYTVKKLASLALLILLFIGIVLIFISIGNRWLFVWGMVIIVISRLVNAFIPWED